jgi:demethylmenaquinone methyltransferase / 2-methoxy-6-polyprenyl-1,4-benzoquinol methylase
MFANISARYDLLNHLLSVGIDQRWRRKVTSLLPVTSGGRILDVACGTGDLAFTLANITEARVVGTDFCRPMLEVAQRKGVNKAVTFVEGDALHLPFPDHSFEGVTIAFGLRNLSSFERGLTELLRVTKPGGRVVVLEFSRPTVAAFRAVFNFYFHRVLPLLGGLVSGSMTAYKYLPSSVTRFPDQPQLAALMREVGFEEVDYSNLTGGIAAIHHGRKPSKSKSLVADY